MSSIKRSMVDEAVANGLRNNRFVAPLFRRIRTEQLIRGGLGSEYFWIFNLAIPGTRALDVGANVGQTSSILGRRIGVDGEVLALEPNPKCFRALRLGARFPILPLQVAAGPTFGRAVLNVPIDSNGERLEQLGTLADREFPSGEEYDRLGVPVIPLDSLLAWTDKPTSLVKIDVEGYELSVIEGAIETITTYRPALVVEIEARHQPTGQSIDDVFRCFSDLGYVLFAIGPTGPFPLSRFDALKHQHDPLAQQLKHTYVNNFIAIHRDDALRQDQLTGVGGLHER